MKRVISKILWIVLMSLAFKIKSGVAVPAFSGQLLHVTTPVDITAATAVKLHWRKTDKSEAAKSGTLTIVVAATGQVKYDWLVNDLTVGKYRAEVAVTWSPTSEERFPSDKYIEFEVLERVDA